MAPEYNTRQRTWYGNSRLAGPQQLATERYGISMQPQYNDRSTHGSVVHDARFEQDVQQRAQGERSTVWHQRSVPRWQSYTKDVHWAVGDKSRAQEMASTNDVANQHRDWRAYVEMRRRQGSEAVMAEGAMASDMEGDSSCNESQSEAEDGEDDDV